MRSYLFFLVFTALLVVAPISTPTAQAAQANTALTDALIDAAGAGDIAKVQSLLQQGANVNGKNKNGFAPLILASLFGKMDVVKLLLDKGADANIQDDGGMAPLILAAGNGNIPLMEMLIDKGAKLDISDSKGRNAAHYAAMRSKLNSLQFLLEKGVDFQASDSEGNTPLLAHIANKPAANKDIITFFLKNGTSIHTQNKKGYTAFTLAVRGENADIVQLLLKNNANKELLPPSETLRSLAATNKHRNSVLETLGESTAADLPKHYEIDPTIMKNAKAKGHEIHGEKFVDVIFLEPRLRVFKASKWPHKVTHHSMRIGLIYKENGQIIMGTYDLQVFGNGASLKNYRFQIPMNLGTNNKTVVNY